MRVTQDLNSFGEIIAHAHCSVDEKIYIFCVYHIRIIAKHNWFTRHETDRFLNNHCQECVRAYLSIMIVYLFFTRSWSAIIGTKQPKVNQSPPQWRGRYTCTRVCRFLVAGNIFRLATCMNSLVKVPPYSQLNFQGKNVFTQDWCNITLIKI